MHYIYLLKHNMYTTQSIKEHLAVRSMEDTEVKLWGCITDFMGLHYLFQYPFIFSTEVAAEYEFDHF